MQTKDVLLFGVGVVAGYLLLRYMKKPCPCQQGMQQQEMTPEQDCETRFQQSIANVRMTPEAYALSKEEFMSLCLQGANPATPLRDEMSITE